MSVAQSARRDRRRALSLEWKLPLVMTGGIGAALAVLLLSTYFVLRRRAESTARERMTHGVRQVALEVTQALSDRGKQFHAVGGDPAVRRALLAARDARVARRTATSPSPAGSGAGRPSRSPCPAPRTSLHRELRLARQASRRPPPDRGESRRPSADQRDPVSRLRKPDEYRRIVAGHDQPWIARDAEHPALRVEIRY